MICKFRTITSVSCLYIFSIILVASRAPRKKVIYYICLVGYLLKFVRIIYFIVENVLYKIFRRKIEKNVKRKIKKNLLSVLNY